jgi:trans-aconitate methyltransferase
VEKPPVRSWDADAYHRLSSPQTAWGRRVLSELTLEGDETVLDAGCGTGKLSAELCERLPRGRLIALDSSADMLRVARETLARFADRVTFVEADLRALAIADASDVFFSTATFHWVKDHDALFAGVSRALRAGGRLHAQCGGGANLARIHARAESLMHASPYAASFREWVEPWYFSSAEDAERRLNAAGFVDVRAWLEDAPTLMPDRETYRAFVEKVILAAHVARLPDDAARARFLDSITDEAERDDPPFSLDYVRLNLRARKP